MNVDYTEYFKPPTDYATPPDANLNGSTQYPHLNAIEYRNLQSSDDVILLPFYEIIEANNDQTLVLLATNSYNNRLWNGSVFGYGSLNDVGKPNADLIKVSVESNVTGIRFLDKSMVIFTDAGGAIRLYSTQSEIRQKSGYSLYEVAKKVEHVGMITGLTILRESDSQPKAVTVSSDGCIKCWDLAPCDIVSTHTYQYAHKEIITGVSNQPKSGDVFATCSRDRFLSIWDVRCRLPLVNSCKNEDYANTACLWTNFNGIDKLYLGDDSGRAYTYDPRKLDTLISSQILFDRPVYKFSLAPFGNMLCVLSQSNTMKVLNTDDTNAVIYEDSASNDYIRDVCWVNKGNKQEQQFHAVGWSHMTQQHIIQNAP